MEEEETKYYTLSDEYHKKFLEDLDKTTTLDKYMFWFGEAADEMRPKHKKMASFIDRIIDKYIAAKDNKDTIKEESNDKSE